jgi:hypothetical protein
MPDPNYGLMETILSHLFLDRAKDNYRATLNAIWLRLDKENARLALEEPEAGWCGHPKEKE